MAGGAGRRRGRGGLAPGARARRLQLLLVLLGWVCGGSRVLLVLLLLPLDLARAHHGARPAQACKERWVRGRRLLLAANSARPGLVRPWRHRYSADRNPDRRTQLQPGAYGFFCFVLLTASHCMLELALNSFSFFFWYRGPGGQTHGLGLARLALVPLS